MTRTFASVLMLSAALAACSSEEAASSADNAADATANSEAVSAPDLDPVGSPRDLDGARSEATRGGYRSAYTVFSTDNCDVTRRETEEGEGVWWRCPGREGVPLFVTVGDGRYDVDAGVENEQFQTVGAFNDLGDTVEWRLHEEKPVAVIFRYLDVTEEAGGRTVLAVEKVGRPGAPGCRVAQISGDTPNANREARRIADTQASDFDCAAEPEYIGNAR